MSLEALLLTLLGAVLSPIISSVYVWLVLRIRQPGLIGYWMSSWETSSGGVNKWTDVKLRVYTGFSGYKMRSLDTKEYKFEGDFRIVNNRYLIGNWRSTRPYDEASGTFLLAKTLDGKCFYGLITAPNSDDYIECKKFVLGRMLEDGQPDLTPDLLEDTMLYINRGRKLLAKTLGLKQQ